MSEVEDNLFSFYNFDAAETDYGITTPAPAHVETRDTPAIPEFLFPLSGAEDNADDTSAPEDNGCKNCGSNTGFFEVDDSSVVCRNCGSVHEHDPTPTRLKVFKLCRHCGRDTNAWANICDHCHGDTSIAGRREPSTYDRHTHLNERIRMDAMLEPRICRKDLIAICDEADNYVARHGRGKGVGVELGRSDVRSILKSLNAKHGTQRFTRKYLEKWKTILSEITNTPPVHMGIMSGRVRNIVGADFLSLSRMWDFLKKRDHPKLRGRSHFPNFNVTFRRIMKHRRIPFDPENWPIPKTEACVRRSNELLNVLFEELAKK